MIATFLATLASTVEFPADLPPPWFGITLGGYWLSGIACLVVAGVLAYTGWIRRGPAARPGRVGHGALRADGGGAGSGGLRGLGCHDGNRGGAAAAALADGAIALGASGRGAAKTAADRGRLRPMPGADGGAVRGQVR